MTWYDKLALAGIGVSAVGAAMFIVGLWYMLDARNQAMVSYRSAIEDARRALHD